MNQIAVYSGNTVIYWSGIIICLGILAWFCLSSALYVKTGGRQLAMLVLLPIAFILSVVISRVLYCHCNYIALSEGLKDFTTGSFVIPGIIVGVVLAAFITVKLGFDDDAGTMLDCLAPGACLGFALFRLSALFNTSCRSKIAVTARILQCLPFASRISTSSGSEYRFATFFIEFILLLILCVYITKLFLKRRKFRVKEGYSPTGNIALLFIIYFGVIELVTDSTRYDSCFMHFNHFVSIVQMFSAVSILAVLVYYSIVSVRVNGRKAMHWFMWVGYFLTLAVTGVAEYMVQRHGDWYLPCYAIMTFSCIMMARVVRKMLLSCCEKK